MGLQSVGIGTNLVSDEVSIFYTNTPEEEIEIRTDVVIPFCKAVKAAEEFFETKTLPECIEWLEL
jgi:hypothetical protein